MTTSARNNTNSLTVPPRQDTQRDREQQQGQNNFQELHPGITVRLHNNNSKNKLVLFSLLFLLFIYLWIMTNDK